MLSLKQAGENATKHHVCFGGSLDAVTQGAAGADKGLATGTTFAPGALDSVTTYYWRMDETVADGSIKTGPVWSFATYLPVDDFESYTDKEGQEVFSTWIDGMTNNTGSTVGLFPDAVNGTFCESTIIHGGKQSMPLDYNNVKAPYYPEAERTWAKPQDWTVGGTAILVLNIRGLATNKTAPVYCSRRTLKSSK